MRVLKRYFTPYIYQQRKTLYNMLHSYICTCSFVLADRHKKITVLYSLFHTPAIVGKSHQLCRNSQKIVNYIKNQKGIQGSILCQMLMFIISASVRTVLYPLICQTVLLLFEICHELSFRKSFILLKNLWESLIKRSFFNCVDI